MKFRWNFLFRFQKMPKKHSDYEQNICPPLSLIQRFILGTFVLVKLEQYFIYYSRLIEFANK